MSSEGGGRRRAGARKYESIYSHIHEMSKGRFGGTFKPFKGHEKPFECVFLSNKEEF